MHLALILFYLSTPTYLAYYLPVMRLKIHRIILNLHNIITFHNINLKGVVHF